MRRFKHACRGGARAAVLAGGIALCAAGSASAAVTSAQIQGYYNDLRAANGIPGDLSLDTASSAKCALHNHYAALNGNDRPDPHQETPGKPGYTTGGDWAARHSELQGGSGLVSAFAPFDAHDPYWEGPFVGAPFHLMGLLNPDATTIWGADSQGGLCLGVSGSRAAPAVDTLYSFPGNGTTIPWAEPYPNEYPTSPEAIAGIPSGTVTGPALMFYWDGPDPDGFSGLNDLVAATLSGPDGRVPVDIVSDLQSDLVPPGAGFVIPVSPLLPGRRYTATVTFATASTASAQRTWTQGISFTTTGPPAAASLVHIAAIRQRGGRLVFVMTADFPAVGQPARLSVKSSDPAMHIQGGSGNLAGPPNEQQYPLAAPGPGGWLRLTLNVPAYTVGGVRMPAATVSKTVHGPSLSSAVKGFAPHPSYSAAAVAGDGIVLSLRTHPGTRMQATLRAGNRIYGGTAVVRAGRSGRVTLVLRMPLGELRALLAGRHRLPLTLALQVASAGAQPFTVSRTLTLTQ